MKKAKSLGTKYTYSWTTASYRAVVLKAMLLGLVLVCQGFKMCDVVLAKWNLHTNTAVRFMADAQRTLSNLLGP